MALDSILRCDFSKDWRSNQYRLNIGNREIFIDASHGELAGEPEGERVIFLTHAHFDHIVALRALQLTTEQALYVHPEERVYLENPAYNLSEYFGARYAMADGQAKVCLYAEGEAIELADGYALRAYHTPGHTLGSVLLLLEKDGAPQALFSGDTLFKSGVGRQDLPGGSAMDLMKSMAKIRQLAVEWPLDLPIYPGHGEATTLREELIHNPYLQEDIL